MIPVSREYWDYYSRFRWEYQILFLFHVTIDTVIPVSGVNIQLLFLFHVNIETIIPVSGVNIQTVSLECT
jgi:hypothetical protein